MKIFIEATILAAIITSYILTLLVFWNITIFGSSMFYEPNKLILYTEFFYFTFLAIPSFWYLFNNKIKKGGN